MPDLQTRPLDARRKAFGDFLRSRRERLTPAAVGLPNGFRRRTPGLRRDEVALLAGVGATWYTWLEQGRDVKPSAEVLGALAVALKLDAVERNHLFVLADRADRRATATGPERVPAAIERMLRNMHDQPAYVLGRRWDILAWNAAAVDVFGDFGRLEGDARNLMGLMFTDAAHRQRLVDWEALAPLSLAMFRAGSAKYRGHADFERLIAWLLVESAEFRAWWPRHDVVYNPSTVKRVRCADGERIFEYTGLDVTECPDMRVIVCTPAS